MPNLISRVRALEPVRPYRNRIRLEQMEERLLCDAALLDLGQTVITEVPDVATQNAELTDESPVTSSDPLGLTWENQALEDAPRVFIVDSANPNAIRDMTGLNRTDVTALTPLANLDALIQPSFLRDGDRIYLRSGEYILSAPIRVDADNVVFSAYDDETAVVRYGSYVYHWAMDVRGDDFTMSGIEMVGNIETDAGRLYSHLMLVIRGDNATIQDSTFRHNSNFLPVEDGGDIAFGNRTDTAGNLRTDDQQKWGRLVAFVDAVGGEFRNNVVVPLEADVVAQWWRGATTVEGLMIERSEVVVEFNQFGAAGHFMINSIQSTVIAKHNTFGDFSDYERIIDMPISDPIRVPATHTAVGLYVNDGSEFSHNLLVFNRANPLDPGNGLQIQGTSNSNVFNNLFVDSGGVGSALHLTFNRYAPIEVETAHNRVFNNTFVNVPTPINLGYSHGVAPEGGTAIHDNDVFNNLVYMTDAVKTNTYRSMNVPLTINLGDPTSGNGNQFSRNLLFDADSETVFKSLSDAGVISYSIDEFNQLPFANGNVSADPQFADAANGEFRVTASSPAILNVAGLQQPSTDFYGNERPTDFLVLGAFGVRPDVSAIPAFAVVGDAVFPSGNVLLTMEPQNTAAQEVGKVSFHLDWNGDGRIDQIVHGPAETVLTHSYSTAGEWTAKIDLYDEAGNLLAMTSHKFQTSSNRGGGDPPPPPPPPGNAKVSIHHNHPFSVQLGTPISATSEALKFLIDWNGDGRVDQTFNAPLGTVVQHSFPTLGEYTVGIQQIDASDQPVAMFDIRVSVEDVDGEENDDEPYVLWIETP